MLPALILGAGACTNYLYDGEIDLTMPEQEFQYPDSYSFNHPCGLVTSSQLTRIKEHVAAADANDPVYACWLGLCNSQYAQSNYVPNPQEILVRGDVTGTGVDSENYIYADRDAAAAFQLALRWLISDDTAYADAAVNVLNKWAAVCKALTANDSNIYLLAGFQGYQFAAAAELLRNYEGWETEDQNTFRQWLLNLWYDKNYYFVNTHGGYENCDLHCWSNWELANMASILAIGIYTEDVDKVNFVYKMFREGTGGGCIDNMIPYDPVEDPDGNTNLIAQSMESGRDQGHATLVVSMCAELCQMAYSLGIDFWGMEDNKVLAMCEYTAKYNVKPDGTYLWNDMPFTTYYYCMDCSCSGSGLNGHGAIHTEISEDSRGTERPGWDLIVSHYSKEKGLGEHYYYYSMLFAEQLRYTDGVLTGDGGAGYSRYGSNSGAFDQLGWGTLLFYQE